MTLTLGNWYSVQCQQWRLAMRLDALDGSTAIMWCEDTGAWRTVPVSRLVHEVPSPEQSAAIVREQSRRVMESVLEEIRRQEQVVCVVRDERRAPDYGRGKLQATYYSHGDYGLTRES